MRAISISATNIQIGRGARPAPAKPERDVSFAPAWHLNDLIVEQQAQDFWRELELVRQSEIEPRLKQLCAIAYAKTEVVAVSTAEPLFLQHLGLWFLQYRCAVSPSHRRHDLAWRLTAFAFGLLEKWSLENPLEDIAGLLATMQAREFAGHLGAPILPKHGLSLVFVGHTPKGDQFRAMWFKHANVEAMFQRASLSALGLSAAE